MKVEDRGDRAFSKARIVRYPRIHQGVQYLLSIPRKEPAIKTCFRVSSLTRHVRSSLDPVKCLVKDLLTWSVVLVGTTVFGSPNWG